MAPRGECIIIDQVNINSVNNKKNELGLHLDKCKSHILCLNDTRLTKRKCLKIKGYKTFRKDRRDGKSLAGGVAILCRNELKAYEVDCSLQEMCIIEFTHANRHFRIATLYLHPGQFLTQSHINAMEKHIPNNSMIVLLGDLNAHIGIDAKKKIDRAGRIINNLISTNNYAVMNDDSPTYYSSSKAVTSCIDLCLTKSSGSSFSSTWSTGDNVGSDHIITTLNIKSRFISENKQIRKTNWEAVRNELEKFNPIIRCNDKNEVEESIDEINSKIRTTLDQFSKTRKTFTRDNIALSAETHELIIFRRRLMKLRQGWEANGKPTTLIRRTINNLNREVKRLIKRDVEAKTATKLEGIFEEKDASKTWKNLKEIEPDIGKKREDDCGNGIKDASGIIRKDDDSIAQIHGDRLSQAHAYPSDPNFDENFRQKIEAEVNELPDSVTDFCRISDSLKASRPEDYFEAERIGRNGRILPPQIHENKITTNEIYHYLKKKKNRSSAGEDGVNYKTLKHAGKNIIGNLAKLFTILLVAGYFPIRWRSVKITMIPKAGKNLQETNLPFQLHVETV